MPISIPLAKDLGTGNAHYDGIPIHDLKRRKREKEAHQRTAKQLMVDNDAI